MQRCELSNHVKMSVDCTRHHAGLAAMSSTHISTRYAQVDSDLEL